MKRFVFFIGIGLLLATGCGTIRQDDSALTTLKVSGSSDAPFTGYLVQHGQRIDISSVTPWTFSGSGISNFQFKKARRYTAINLEVFYDEGKGIHTTDAIAIPAGMTGLQGRVTHHGPEMELLR